MVVGKLEGGTSAFALTAPMGVAGTSHCCRTQTRIFRVKFPSMTNLPFLHCMFELFSFQKSVLGNTQAARRLKATQASYFLCLFLGV